MPRVQTLIAIMLLASCCVGTSLMAHQRVPNLVFQEVAKANAERAAAKAAAVEAQAQARTVVNTDVASSSLAGAK
jgi:hypothetical protein